MNAETPVEAARNIGPICGSELRAVGISTVGELRRLGWEEAFARWVRRFPERLNQNAARALIGAVEDCDWREVPESMRAEARTLIRSLKG